MVLFNVIMFGIFEMYSILKIVKCKIIIFIFVKCCID